MSNDSIEIDELLNFFKHDFVAVFDEMLPKFFILSTGLDSSGGEFDFWTLPLKVLFFESSLGLFLLDLLSEYE
jgi:hypothetical protein